MNTIGKERRKKEETVNRKKKKEILDGLQEQQWKIKILSVGALKKKKSRVWFYKPAI
jgi:hypothetical protein